MVKEKEEGSLCAKLKSVLKPSNLVILHSVVLAFVLFLIYIFLTNALPSTILRTLVVLGTFVAIVLESIVVYGNKFT